MSTRPKSMLISGWRGLPQSYAIVNEFQCLELLRRDDVTLYFEDRPYYDSRWERVSGLFSPQAEEAIAAIPALPAGVIPDAELRIGFPFDLVSPPRAEMTLVYGTAEYQAVPRMHLLKQMPLQEAHSLHDGSTKIVTPSSWSRDGFIRSGADPERVVVVPHGVDPGLFHPPKSEDRSEAREKYKLGTGEFVFLNIGAMSGNKNIGMLLRAFASVLRDAPAARLVLKGMDALYPSQRMFMSAALQGLTSEEAHLALPRVIYLGGSLSFIEVRRLYHAADCYVSPYTAEGFNLPVLEAAACGLPIICTGGGPTDEFTTEAFARRIHSGRILGELDGLPTTALDPKVGHLTELMESMVVDEDFRKTAATAGPVFVAENLTWQHAVDCLLAISFSSK